VIFGKRKGYCEMSKFRNISTHRSSSELNRCLSEGIDKSKVPFGTGGKLEFASKLIFGGPFLSFAFSSSSSSESVSLESDVSSRISDTSDDVESESGSVGDEIGGDVGSCRAGAEVVRGGNGGGAFSSSLSLPVAISRLSNSLKV
jgi:hypothetical protein